jgi:hypothetical protein
MNRFRTWIIASLTASAVALTAIVPAQAGGYGKTYNNGNRHYGQQAEQSTTIWRNQQRKAISLHQLKNGVLGLGYGLITDIDRRGDVYIVSAVRNNGAIHQLTINVWSGEVLRIKRAGWTRVPVPWGKNGY